MYIGLSLDQEAHIYEWKTQQQQGTEYSTEQVVWGRGRGTVQIVSKRPCVSEKCPEMFSFSQESCCYSGQRNLLLLNFLQRER